LNGTVCTFVARPTVIFDESEIKLNCEESKDSYYGSALEELWSFISM
jgi:hypothetical protein